VNHDRVGGTLELPLEGNKGTMDRRDLVEFKHSSKLVEQSNLRIFIQTGVVQPETVPTKSTCGDRSTISRNRSVTLKRAVGFH